MNDAERTELLEVVGTAVAEKAEGLIAPLTERLDKFETQLGEVAEKAEAAAKGEKPEGGDPDGDKDAAAKGEEKIKELEDELAAAKAEHDEFVKEINGKLEELGAAPKSVSDEGVPDPKPEKTDSGRDAFGRKMKKGEGK